MKTDEKSSPKRPLSVQPSCDCELVRERSGPFILPGRPRPTPRPRSTKKGGYYPASYYKYLNGLIAMIRYLKIPKKDYGGLHILFYFAHPSATKVADKVDLVPCRRLADFDNLAKGVADALQKSGVIQDDRQLWDCSQLKFYTTGKERMEFYLIEEISVDKS